MKFLFSGSLASLVMEVEMSETQKALAYLKEHPEMSVYAVAKMHQLSPNTLYTAINREKAKADKETCPCCQQIVREGFEIDWSVVK